MFTVALGSDHAGVALKDAIAAHLVESGVDVVDLGTNGPDSVDYPDFGEAVGRAVVDGRGRFGIAVCGSGLGICIAANKVGGVRAVTVHDVTTARLSRLHNDANVLCLGERIVGPAVAIDAVDAFLSTEFEGGRHAARVDKIGQIVSAT